MPVRTAIVTAEIAWKATAIFSCKAEQARNSRASFAAWMRRGLGMTACLPKLTSSASLQAPS
jgi:hypothetical protein